MGIRFFLIFIAFFMLVSTFLFYSKAKTLSVDINAKETPLMVLKDSKIYDMTFEGITSYLQSKRAKRYRDRYELYSLYSNNQDKNATQKIWADKGVLKDSILTLSGNVLYKDMKEQTLKSDTVVYNLKKDILSSDTHFVATYKNSKVKGSSFVYFKKDKKLFANNIKADIILEE